VYTFERKKAPKIGGFNDKKMDYCGRSASFEREAKLKQFGSYLSLGNSSYSFSGAGLTPSCQLFGVGVQKI
jgi:hypothetical protein